MKLPVYQVTDLPSYRSTKLPIYQLTNYQRRHHGTGQGIIRRRDQQIRNRTEELLETVGLRVDHAGLLRMCQATGATVDEPAARVRFPRPLLRELLASVPSSYTVRSPAGAEHVIGGGKQYATAIVTDPWIVDYETQKPQALPRQRAAPHQVIAQKLEPVVAMSLMDFPLTDVPEPKNSTVPRFEEHVLYHDKHIMIYATNEERRGLAQRRPHGRGLGRPDPAPTGECGRRCALAAGGLGAQRGVPAQRLRQQPAGDPRTCPIAGMTSPYSLAATLLQADVKDDRAGRADAGGAPRPPLSLRHGAFARTRGGVRHARSRRSSRRSTTRSVATAATRRCATGPRRSPPSCAAATSCAGTAPTSSCWCCRTPPISKRTWSWRVCSRRCRSRPPRPAAAPSALTASAGVASFPADGLSVEDLVAKATTTMYAAQAGGAGQIGFSSGRQRS